MDGIGSCRNSPGTRSPGDATLAGRNTARRTGRELLAVGIATALVLNPCVGTIAVGSPARPAAGPTALALLPYVPAGSPKTLVDSDATSKAELARRLGKLPLHFIENRGQIDGGVAFYVTGSDTSVYFSSGGVTYVLSELLEAQTPDRGPAPGEAASRRRWSLALDFVDANEQVRPGGEDRTSAVVSYFKGSRESWRTGLPTYGGVVYRELWPGIDLQYSGTSGQLKYTFVVQPGADPERIQLAYRGATAVGLAEDGRLRVSTPVRGFEEEKPYAYQETDGQQVRVDASYALQGTSPSDGTRFGFRLGSYDRTKPLILDPAQLLYSGYIGGMAIDQADGIAVDASGYAYVTGRTDSSEVAGGFPATGSWDTSYAGGTDAFVAKVDPAGALVYCGYIGGTGTDEGSAIAVDGFGNAYVTGDTTSGVGFPVIGASFDTSFAGASEGFVVKIKADGSSLVYSGFVGGSGADAGEGIAVSAGGEAYVVGYTSSTNFPVTAGLDISYNGGTFDAFVAKIDAGGMGFLYSGYIGGAELDDARGVAVDSLGNAYVVGYTNSTTGFPLVAWPYPTYNGGNFDAFVAKVRGDGAGLVYCGYIGGSGEDLGQGIAVDAFGSAHVVGYTASSETQQFPVRVGPDLSFNGGIDVFVAKVKDDGTSLVYCGYIGGSGNDYGNGIAVDGSGSAYVVGYTGSTGAQGFPVTVGPDLTYNGGTYDAFVAKIDPTTTALVYCGYMGGTGNDVGTGIAVDVSGNAYVAGRTAGLGFPVIAGPDLTYNLGTYDAFVAKIGATTSAVADLAVTKTDGQTSAVPGKPITYTITVTNNGPGTISSLFVSDPVPAQIDGAVFTAPPGTSYNAVTGEWTGLNLGPGDSVILELDGTIKPDARGSLVNRASVTPPSGFTDPNGPNDSTDTDTLDPSVDVRIDKTADVATVPLGELLTYTLTVTNDGPSTATSVAVSDTLPVDMILDAGTGAIGSSQGSCVFDVPTRTVSCSLGSIGPTASATVTIKVRLQALRTFVNTATVTCSEPTDPPGNNSDSETTQVDVSSVGVRVLTVTSTSQRNVLEWMNPTDVDYVSTEIRVKEAGFPANVGDGVPLYNGNDGGSGGRWKIVHDTGASSNGKTYYYGAFVHRTPTASPTVSPGRFVTGRPFDHTVGPVRWAFSTGTTALAPPTVGGVGVIATSNDHVVYAMQRGTDDDRVGVDSGEWPASFRPVALGGPVQQRSPVVSVPVEKSPGVFANPVVYLGAQDGNVYVVDATQGGPGFPKGPTSLGQMVQAAPAGIFKAFGGALDALLLGTRDDMARNAFVALDPYTLAPLYRFDNGLDGDIGIVSGMAAVEYGPPLPPRVYFTSRTRTPGSANTLWCFTLSETSPVLSLLWARQLGDIDSSPVVRNGRVYVGSPQDGGTIFSIDALDGANSALDRTFRHGNGQVRGFIFPERSSRDIYFATDDYVWGLTDNDTGIVEKFSRIGLGGLKPSPVLFVAASQHLYIGGSNGWLFEVDLLSSPPTVSPVVLGDGKASVGAPSFDWQNSLVHVGTAAGIFYAVEAPLQPGGMCVADCSGQPDGTPCSSTYPSNCFCSCVSGTCNGGC